jgi:hypothetical protein
VDINGAADISGNLVVGGNASLTGGSYFAAESYRYTDGTSSMTIGSDGRVNAVSGVTSTGGGNIFGATSFNDADITNVGSIAVDFIINDGTDITLDSSGDIILDADGADIRLKDAGTEFGRLANSSNNFIVASSVSNANVVIQGNDGGSTITACTFDMSEAGAATFNSKITAVGSSVFTNLDISGDVDVDGTLEADAITLNGTALGSIYSPIAGSGSIVTTGALNSGSITSGFGTINNGSSTITTSGAVATGALTVTGAIVASGDITAFSDLRIKDNLEVIPDALSKVEQLSGYTYTRKDLEDKEEKYTGVIAQEVLKVLPEAVVLGETPEDNMAVAYGNMVGLLIEAVKELSARVKELEGK